jgi:hypothetical protein
VNWQAIGALGEIVGAAAVVVSLLYLATQVRQSTRMMRAQAARDALGAMAEFSKPMMADPATARVFRIGTEDPGQLDVDERSQFGFLVFNFLKTAEALHNQFLNGTLQPDAWYGWEHVFAQYAKSPGFAAVWSIRSRAYSPAFRALYDSWPEGGGMRTEQIMRSMVDHGA